MGMVSGEVLRSQLRHGTKLKNLDGEDLDIRISGSTVSVDKAKITFADGIAVNGVFHVVDKVLMPPGPARPPHMSTCKATVMADIYCNNGVQIDLGNRPMDKP